MASAPADTLRIASWNSGLKRDGPGLLLRDILRNEDPQIAAASGLISRVEADILVVLNFDFDLDLIAADALVRTLASPHLYPHRFALEPNSGVPTGRDIDGDGYFGDATDAHGYAPFPGQGGILVLSRWPILRSEVTDFSNFLWAEMPENLMTAAEAARFGDVLRLHSVAAWQVPVDAPGGRFDLLVWHAGSPVFDGPEDRNGRRNDDENNFWSALLSGRLPFAAPTRPFILAGSANLDPFDGQGRQDRWRAFLEDPQVQDVRPATSDQEPEPVGQSPDHEGDPDQDTADWKEEGGPGNLRVQYVLPSAHWQVARSGIAWPDPEGSRRQDGSVRSRHGMVWMDLRR